ncbi:MAG: hypothetical protein ACQGVC_24040 [Myxococcota bacterium]
MKRGLAWAALGLLLGCATPGPPGTPPPLPADDPRPAERLARWSAGQDERRALRATARLAVDAEPDLRVRSKQRVVLARPARLRVEVQGLLGATVAVLAVDDAEYAFFDSADHRFESGPVHDDLLWNVVRLDLAPAEAVGLLLGAPALPAGLRVLAAHPAGDGRIGVVLGTGEGRRSRILDLDEQARLVRFELFEAGAPRWVAELSDYADVGGVPLAHRVTVETRDGARAVVTLSGVELNPPLSADIFRIDGLRPAAGATGEGG